MVQSSIATDLRLKLWMRVAGIVLILGTEFLYGPVNQSLSGGVALSLPIDDLIPLWLIWSVPYLLALPWWIGATIWGGLTWAVGAYLIAKRIAGWRTIENKTCE